MTPQAALQASREMLRSIVDATTAVIYVKDLDGRYLLINRRFEELFHVTEEEARGRTDHELFPKDTADRFRANDLDVQRTKTAVEFEEYAPHDDGPHTYISLKFPLVHPSGDLYAVCGISTDITARKRAEAELAATKESLERLVDERTADLREANRRLTAEIAERVAAVDRLQHLIDTANEGIWMIDAQGVTTFVNARMAEMLGHTVAEMIGRSLLEFMSEERRGEAFRQLERRRRGIAERHDFELRRKDGSSLWCLISANPISGESGTVVGALAMVTDITDRKRSEEQQLLLLRELDHRVKNTLATVLALSELSLEGVTSLQEFRATFGGRLRAMARSHEALARTRWKNAALDEVATVVLAPFVPNGSDTIAMRGEAIQISATAITPIALALNELGTNALKHGALSCAGGGVSVEWGIADDGSFFLDWAERDGPTAAAPSSDGSGLRLIRGLIEHELGGEVGLDFAPEGLSCRITIPAHAITPVRG